MKDILYRAYHKRFKQYLQIKNIDFFYKTTTLLYNKSYIEVSFEDIELEMFFGKKDKKGNPIFEGDIVFVPSGWSGDYLEKEHLDIIEWDETGFIFTGSDDCCWSDLEVLGNKNENMNIIDEKEAMEMLEKELRKRG